MGITTTISAAAASLAGRGVAYARQIAAAAERNGVDPRLLAAVAAQETGGPGSNTGHNVVGDGGHGHGLFQIDDRWHAFALEERAMDPQSNADYAAGMIAGLLRRYGGNVREALSAYNAGSPAAMGTVTRWGDGRTLGYADSVLRHYAMLGGDPPDIRAGSNALVAALQAESPNEVAAVNTLARFALGSPYRPPQSASPHNYRQLAGFDGQGRSGGMYDIASIVDPDDDSSSNDT